jgi:hypothetical protein
VLVDTARVLQFYDTFTDSNKDVHLHTPDLDLSGNGWTQSYGNGKIMTNRYTTDYIAYPYAITTMDVGAADVTIQSKHSTQSTADTHYRTYGILRYTNTNNFWRYGINTGGNKIVLSERNAGSETVRASAAVTIDTYTWYTLDVVATGATITLSLGEVSCSYNAATLNQTATKHGLGCYNAQSYCDDFQVWA